MKKEKGVRASQEVNNRYLNLVDDLGGKGSTVLTAWRAVPSQLQSILSRHGKSWDFQHSVEGCSHFSFDECYKEQGTNSVYFSLSLQQGRQLFPNTTLISLSFQGPWRMREGRFTLSNPSHPELPLYSTGRGTGGESVLTHSYKSQPPIATRYHWQLISFSIKISQ